ncbi:MAG: hypothetical protein AB9873_11490 [Syntrophobacteraceae bacterium]
MKHSWLKRQFGARSAVLLLMSFLLVFTFAAVARSWEATDAEMKAYVQSLEQTRETSQDEVFRELIAVIPDSDAVNEKRLCGGDLVWEGEPGKSRILVAAFMDRAAYERYYKPSLDEHLESYRLTKSLWVTVVPELRNAFMRGCKRDRPLKIERCPPTPKRIAKLLGLPPRKDYEILVELWVSPGDLFRPSADPDITDHEAEPAIKTGEGLWSFRSDQNPFARIDETQLFLDYAGGSAVPFKTWYAETARHYDPLNWDAPWTRLGYTYDWGSARNHVGVSEFIVRIHPDPASQYVEVRLERAIDSATPDWNDYFQCRPPTRLVGEAKASSCR